MGKYLGDLLVVLGCVAILIGVWQVCPVATWFVGGAMLAGAGAVVEAGQRSGK